MLHIKDGVKIISIDDSYSENERDMYTIYLNTKNTIIAPKDFLCVFTFLNGLLQREQLEMVMSSRWGKDNGSRSLQEILQWEICEEIDVSDYCMNSGMQPFLLNLSKKVVIFEDLTDLTIDLVILLSAFGIKMFKIVSSDRSIINDDYHSSIFLKKSDVGKNFSSFFVNNGVECEFSYKESIQDIEDVCIIYSGINSIGNYDKALLFNVDAYENIRGFGFDIFNNAMDLSANVEVPVKNLIWSFRVCEDIFFSIGNGVYS